jgi:hypothetical protein
MRLSAIEIVVGERMEEPDTRRRLSYLASFWNDAEEPCRSCVHEMTIPERSLNDPACMARVVAHVVRGLLSEFSDPEPHRVEEPRGALPSP